LRLWLLPAVGGATRVGAVGDSQTAEGAETAGEETMRAIWLLTALGLSVVTGYLTWYGIAERAHAPEDFVNLVALLTLFCGAGAGTAWGRIIRKARQQNPTNQRNLREG
jgi:hypothetical protein